MSISNPPVPVVIEEENYVEVEHYTDLPDASGRDGEVYLVQVGTGIFGVNRKRAGLWRSNGVEWKRLGALTGSGGVLFSSPPDGKKRVHNIYYDPAISKYTFEREE